MPIYYINIHNNNRISHMAFADDLVLFAKDDGSLQNQVDHVLNRLKECGLNINTSKCATLNIIINPNKKNGYAIRIVLFILMNVQLKH